MAETELMPLEWSVDDRRFVSRPVEVPDAGVVVAYTAQDGTISLNAYDPESGEELWHRDSTASSVTAGVKISVTANDSHVFHYVQGTSGDAIEAVDAETGSASWTSAGADSFFDPAVFCDDNRSAVCATPLEEGAAASPWQVDVDTGQVTRADGTTLNLIGPSRSQAESTQPAQAADNGRRIGFDLYDLDNGNIARIVDGEIIWQRSPSELFGGAEVSPDFGWLFRRSGDVIVGTLGVGFEQPHGEV